MKRLSLAMVTLLACAGAQAASEKVEMNSGDGARRRTVYRHRRHR